MHPFPAHQWFLTLLIGFSGVKILHFDIVAFISLFFLTYYFVVVLVFNFFLKQALTMFPRVALNFLYSPDWL